MFSFLRGIIEEKSEGLLVLDVGGVGYELAVSSNTLTSLPHEGDIVKIFTYMAVREDGVYLFGFATREEKELFLKLISVSGVGPKMAIAILSGLNLSDLSIAIQTGDVKILCTIKGLGKKTAERICLELKNKIGLTMPNETTFNVNYNEDAVSLATETLISLGINRNEAYTLARSCADENSTAEDIISKALRGYKA